MKNPLISPLTSSLAICLVSHLTLSQPALSQSRALPVNRSIDDARLGPPKDLNGYFPFTPPERLEDWEERKASLTLQLRVAAGLWPEPEKTPLYPVIHGRRDMGDYTVDKVYFESLPGFYVTGSLFKPKTQGVKHPGVLSPHGHWSNGRFYDAGENEAKNQIAIGAERFLSAARNPMQARSVQLARMGCVVFQYDMIGYADSIQIPESIAHGFRQQRESMNKDGHWGLFSAKAENRLQNVLGLQTWNSVRALDFLSSLPDVDTNRLAVTGASGGGTQTFMLAALDPRIQVAFPAVMVSTAMQGGCTCENASLLRIGTGNVEIAALFAPKPQGMTAANDWTREMATKGFPDLKKLYGLFDQPDHVHLTPLVHFGHNYNHVSRTAMYQWMNKHLKLGLPTPVLESDFERLTRDELTVWKGQQEPATGETFEASLLRDLHKSNQAQVKELASSKQVYVDVMQGGWRSIIGRTIQDSGDIEWELTHKKETRYGLEMAGLLHNRFFKESLPTLFLYPDKGNGQTLIWIHPQGKGAVYDKEGLLRGEITELLSKGFTIAAPDLFMQGEFLQNNSEEPVKNRLVATEREFAGYTYGYNHSLFSQRVHDILSLLAYIKSSDRQKGPIILAGIEGGGKWAAPALALCSGAVSKALLQTNDFDFDSISDFRDADFLPGGVRYLGLAGALSLAGNIPIGLDSANVLKETKALTQGWEDGPDLSQTDSSTWVDWIQGL